MKESFNGWIISKINKLMKNHEGMNVEETTYGFDCVTSVITDSFGYRYEIQVKTLGRLGNQIENIESNPYYDDTLLQKTVKAHE